MTINSRIMFGKDISAKATADGRLVVANTEFKECEPVTKPFLNDAFGNDMTVAVTFSGTPTNMYDGGDDTIGTGWTVSTLSGDADDFIEESTDEAKTGTKSLDFSPAVNGRKLLYTAPERTNLLLWSEDFGSVWVNDGVTLTADNALAPDGTTTMDKLESVDSVADGIYQTFTPTADSNHTNSVYLKCDDAGSTRLFYQRPTTVYGANIIPDMTSNTAPSGVASADSELGASYQAWNAMTRNDYLYWYPARDPVTPPCWLQYQFDSAKIIAQYTLTHAYDADRMFKDWIFKGSNDGSTWVDLDTVTGETGWTTDEKRVYTFDNTTAYEYYRIACSANNGHHYTMIAEFEMMEPEIDFIESDTLEIAWTAGVPSVSSSTGSVDNVAFEDVGDDTWRVSYSTLEGVSSVETRFTVEPASVGDNGTGVWAWGAMIELGDTLTPYVKSEGTQGTSTEVLHDSFTALTGAIYLTGWSDAGSDKDVKLRFRLAGADVGDELDLSSYINVALFYDWQSFAIDLDDFNLTGTAVDEFVTHIVDVGAGPPPDGYMDVMQLEEAGEPLVYYMRPDVGSKLRIDKIRFTIADDLGWPTVTPYLPYDALMGEDALKVGIIMSEVKNNTVTNTVIFKQLSDFLTAGGNLVNWMSDGINSCIVFEIPYHRHNEFSGSPSQNYITLTVADDLRGLQILQAVAIGEVEIEA